MNSKLKECHPGVSLWRTIGSMRLVCALVAFSAMMFFSACSNYQEEFDNNFGALEYADDEGESSPSGGDDPQSSPSGDNDSLSSSVPTSSGGIQSSSSTVPLVEGDSLNDFRDGKKYKLVTIGEQKWMAENLNFETEKSRCYDNSNGNCLKYGRLYTWADAQSACPEGTHLPTDAEMKILEEHILDSLDHSARAGNMLKSTEGWADGGSSNKGKDFYGFTGLPAGMWKDGKYVKKDSSAAFWSADEAIGRELYYGNAVFARLINQSLENGFSVRCLVGEKKAEATSSSSSLSSSSSAQSSSSSILPYTPPSGPNYDTLDYNGQKYRTVKIGDQEWMAENMNAVVDGSTCYRDSSIYCDMYGRLYSWDAAMKVCPEGWRLPDTTDWSILFKSVGGKATAATHLKATTSWTKNGDGNGDDAFGFSAFAAGGSDTGSDVKYAGKGIDAAFWTSEVKNSYDAWGVGMYWADSHPKIEVYTLASNRRSVRCIKESNSSSSSSVASSSSVSSSSQSSSSEKTEKCYGKEYTPSTHFCDDRDGAIYRYFTTELVTWMAENLNYEMQESYCPEDETEKCEKYGRLYTWEAAKVACPSGWHLASSNEYGQLRYDVGNVANRLMSESWNGQDGIGFDALPAGYRYSSGSGYNNVGKRAYFWTSTEETSTTSNYMDIAYRESSAQYMIEIVLEGDRKEAYSVRCAKDR